MGQREAHLRLLEARCQVDDVMPLHLEGLGPHLFMCGSDANRPLQPRSDHRHSQSKRPGSFRSLGRGRDLDRQPTP
jgi:hypothetical protein